MKSIQIPVLDYKLAADWYEGSTEEILLVLIGYTSSKDTYHELLNDIHNQTDSSILVFDYAGHGQSPFDLKDVTPAQNFLEVITIYDWLKQKYPRHTLNVMGTSYGGFLAVQLTKYRQFAKLVLRVPAIYEPEEFYTPWGIRLNDEEAYRLHEDGYRTNTVQLAKHPILARAARFKGKTLVVVHENDELVPKVTTDAYIKAFNADKYSAKGFKHSFLSNPSQAAREAYRQVIADWLKKN